MNGVCQYRSSFFPLGIYYYIVPRRVHIIFLPNTWVQNHMLRYPRVVIIKKKIFINVFVLVCKIFSHITSMLVVLLIHNITLCTILYNTILLLYLLLLLLPVKHITFISCCRCLWMYIMHSCLSQTNNLSKSIVIVMVVGFLV